MRSSTSPFRGRNYPSSSTPESLEAVVMRLQRENNSLVEEIQLAKNKNKKVSQLEQKIQLILKHNNQLLNENQRLARLINQKKGQVEVWKNKLDDATSNRATAADMEIKRLLNEIDKLKEDIVQMEHLKNKQLSDVKHQFQNQIQNLKKTNMNSIERYELEIRKLKEYCEKKDYEVTDSNTKLVRICKENQFQITKLKEDRERLKSDLHYEQVEHRKEVDKLRAMYEYERNSEIQTIKKQHLNQIQAMDYENTKLKEVINNKHHEIEQIMIKNGKVKDNYEDSLSVAYRENEDLKLRILQTEESAQVELARLRDKMEGIKESELALLKNAHNRQMELLNQQIRRLQGFLDDRAAEMENLSKERSQMRIELQAQILKLKSELHISIEQNTSLQTKHAEEVRRLDQDYHHKNQQMKNMESHFRKEVEILRDENKSLSEALQSRQNQLERQRRQYEKNEKNYKQEVSTLRQKASNLKQQFERSNRKSNSEIEDTRKTYELKVQLLETKINGSNKENQELKNLVADLKETIVNKERQIKLGQEKIDLLETIERQLRRQASDNESRWDTKEKQFNRLLKEQIKNMESTRVKEVQQLNGIHTNKSNTFKHQISQLERQIEGKNKLLNNLKASYEELENKFNEIFSQRAAQKDLDVKVPGWIPDTIATKSLFDVFLKNKVLEYCS